MLVLSLLLACKGPEDTDITGDPGARDDNLASASGDYALDYLRAEPYSRIVVEIDHVEGYAPSQEAQDRLVAVIEDLCFKPDGVEIQIDDVLPPQGSPEWTVTAAQDLEIEHRDQYRDEEAGIAVVYGLWLDGNSDADDSSGKVLGYAVHGSSLVMFGETIADTGGAILLPNDIEPVVLAHEMGHLLGLVNNGVPMVADHQDEAHGAHDDDDECLMYWAVETSNVVDLLLGDEPDFDAACRADLAAAGGAG